MSQEKSSTAAEIFMGLLGLGLAIIICRTALWIFYGVYSWLTAVFWGLIYFIGYCLGLIVALMLLSLLDAVRLRMLRNRDFRSALGRSTYPRKASFESGIGENGVDQVFTIVLKELYESKYGSLNRRLAETEFSYIKYKLFKKMLRKPQYRSIIEQEVFAPVSSIWNAGTDKSLDRFIESCISNERRRKLFWIPMIFLHTATKGWIGYEIDKIHYYRSVGELRSSQTALFQFLWKMALPNLKFLAQVLGCEEEDQLIEASNMAEETELLEAPTESVKYEMVEPEFIEAEYTDSYDEEDITQSQIEQEAIEVFKLACQQLYYDCPEWSDAEAHLMTLGDIFDCLIEESYPNPDDCEEVLLIISEALQRLPFFEQAFADSMEIGPDEVFESQWMQQVSAEFSSGEIESCLSTFERIAVRCFVLSSDPLPTDETPTTDEMADEEIPLKDSTEFTSEPTEPDEPASSDAHTADFTTSMNETKAEPPTEPEIAPQGPKTPANGVQNPSPQSTNAPIGF